ncbi:DUF4166 domain-containing protein [Microbacterium sp. P06]|uniref:DUF4166 domain-containing protein n=1 Tax=Microbacterium sp. P06 TaxID=3366949 RepID=UPI003746B134
MRSEVGPSGEDARSVYQRVLGERFTQLDPQLRTYFGALPPGAVGRGEGVYAVAGSRHRWLWPVLAVLAWRRVLFPELGTDVPFTVQNTAGADGTLSAVRTFSFPRVERRMEDTMRVVDGRFVDGLGRRRGLVVEMELSVEAGSVKMRSRRVWVRIAGRHLPLGRLARVTLHERADAAEPGRQHVDVRISLPLLGEVFR